MFGGRIVEHRVLRRVTETAADRICGTQPRWSGLCPGEFMFVIRFATRLIDGQALLQAHKLVDEPERAIGESVRRIAFLGTPFRGSDTAWWADMGRKLASLLQDTNKTILSDLKQESYQLKAIAEEFPQWLREREGKPETKVEIVFFTEELTTGNLGKVSEPKPDQDDVADRVKIVTDDSAHIKGYKALTLHANHQDMCKFSGKDDDKYQAVLDVLRRWVNKLKEPPEEVKKPREVSSTTGWIKETHGGEAEAKEHALSLLERSSRRFHGEANGRSRLLAM